MAISDEPETGGTAFETDSDLHRSSLRRRHSATSDFDADNLVTDLGSSDSLNSKSNDEEDNNDDKKQHATADNGIQNDTVDRERVTDVKFTYRPYVPVHRKIKESPLSSGNIFKQVNFFALILGSNFACHV
ncbi:putative diacylglycerol O-acyltransferase [Lupinus albus]|uniref:Putative diacylglycerol O-acyltransferase n=1 Tax=Lupinus albus TaxID=3870 RepID=A0A6A4PST2_LUPAL|nr:putative diacylglycerol O-acyltransferase [Lupinus albus]